MAASMGFRVRTLDARFVLCLAVLTIALCPCLAAVQRASPAGATTTKVSPAFIAKVNAYCSAQEARFNKTLGKFPFDNFDPTHPDLSTMRKVGAHFAESLPIRRGIPASLMKLGEPEVGKAQWDALRTLAIQSDRLGISQVHIALTGTTEEFVANVNQTTAIQNKLESTAVKDGFSKKTPCGDVF
jgi:hypothetical protein